MKNILIIGGAGYVGTVLTENLLEKGYFVTVYDLLIYGNNISDHKNLKVIKGDIRDLDYLKKIVKGFDALIHLACISNDPSFDLDPELGKSINYDPFEKLVKLAKDSGIKRFIYASSSSVYGIKSEKNVDESFSIQPLTDYSKYKAMCEEILNKYSDTNFICTSIRPATVCGFSPRQRFDLVVNILMNNAYNKKEITVFGGNQLRPNIHINDMCLAYIMLLKSDKNLINGQAFNVGYENHSVLQLANLTKTSLGDDIKITQIPSNDDRSYHISSNKIKNILKFEPKFTIEDAILDLKNAFLKNLFKDSLENEMYFNIKRMKSIDLM